MRSNQVETTVGTWFTYLIIAITLTAIGWVVWGVFQ